MDGHLRLGLPRGNVSSSGLHQLIPGGQVYLAGLIPLFVGIAILAYVSLMAPNE